jgi:hypothetical protein
VLVGEIVEPVGLVRALAGDAHRIEVRTQQSAEARFEQTVRFLCAQVRFLLKQRSSEESRERALR